MSGHASYWTYRKPRRWCVYQLRSATLNYVYAVCRSALYNVVYAVFQCGSAWRGSRKTSASYRSPRYTFCTLRYATRLKPGYGPSALLSSYSRTSPGSL